MFPWAEKFLPTSQEVPQDCVQGEWTFNGKTNQGCATPKGTKAEVGVKKLWCPTQLKEDGSYENGSGKYRICNGKYYDRTFQRLSCILKYFQFIAVVAGKMENPEGVQLISNAISWMTSGKATPKVAANLDNLDAQFGMTYDSIEEALEDSDLDVFILTRYSKWPEDLAERLKTFMENGGNFVLATGNDQDLSL